jgi:hypothetical protein
MKPTDISAPDYFHKVVDCQWACPAHTPVPEYIRLIAQGRYSDAYMINWKANVFPGILGRTCDRPCEPACRRARVEENPVAICRLKRVAADFKDDIRSRLLNERYVQCVLAFTVYPDPESLFSLHATRKINLCNITCYDHF